MSRAVVLLSGGLDSTTCLAVAKQAHRSCYALSFDYGQKHDAELAAAARVAQAHRVAEHRVVKLSLAALAASSLTSTELAVPDYQAGDEIPSTYVPARNTTFLAIAMGWAEMLSAAAIYIGVSAVDYSGYPDCRPAFIEAFQALSNVATRCGVEGQPIEIHAPLLHLSKAETIALGVRLGVNYALTVSCYRANDAGQACGRCDSCTFRKQGFVEARIDDPTVYYEA